jgi:hypothetical protein
VRIRLVRLQELRRRLDGDDLAQTANDQGQVHATDLPDVDRHAGSDRFLEPLQRDLHVVGPGRHIRERIAALCIGCRLAGEIGVGVHDRDPCPGNGRSLRIGHTADEAAIQDLCFGGECRHRHYQGQTHRVEQRSPPRVVAHNPPPGMLSNALALRELCARARVRAP